MQALHEPFTVDLALQNREQSFHLGGDLGGRCIQGFRGLLGGNMSARHAS